MCSQKGLLWHIPRNRADHHQARTAGRVALNQKQQMEGFLCFNSWMRITGMYLGKSGLRPSKLINSSAL